MLGLVLKYTRFILGGVIFFVVCFLGLLMALMRPFDPRNMRLVAKSFAWSATPLMGIEFSVENPEYLKDESSKVYVSNHQDNTDLIVFPFVLAPKTVTLGKKSLVWIPIFGQMYWLVGNILIDRFNKTRARASMGKVNRLIRDKNISIWIMPEGTRSRGRGLLPFKTGAFRTAIEAQVPIVPICFNNYHQSLDYRRLKSGRVACRILPPIPTKGMTKEDIPELVKKCRSQMEDCISELDQNYSYTS